MAIKNNRKPKNMNKNRKKKVTLVAIITMLATGIEFVNDSLELILNFVGNEEMNELNNNSESVEESDNLTDLLYFQDSFIPI